MKAFVSIAIACILLATGSPLAIAQTSTISQPPASSATTPSTLNLATKNDLRRTEGTLTKALKQDQAQNKANSDQTAQQLKDMRAADDKRIHDFAQQQADAQRTAEHNAKVHDKLFGEFAAVMIMLIIIVSILGGRWREAKSNREPAEVAAPSVSAGLNEMANIATLEENAKPERVKAYAEKTNQVGESFAYTVRLEKNDPNNPAEKIFIGTIVGKVCEAGTPKEFYDFDGITAVARKRFNAALEAFEKREKHAGIHLARKTA